jgi:hypothetical protein
MSAADRVAVLRECGECADSDAQLEELVAAPGTLIYDGIEPSARMTLAQVCRVFYGNFASQPCLDFCISFSMFCFRVC